MRRGSVSVKEYIERKQERYRPAGRGERGRLLDEIVAVTGYHRKSATRLMARSRSERVQRNGRGARGGMGRRWRQRFDRCRR